MAAATRVERMYAMMTTMIRVDDASIGIVVGMEAEGSMSISASLKVETIRTSYLCKDHCHRHLAKDEADAMVFIDLIDRTISPYTPAPRWTQSIRCTQPY
jgi:hypothetical protein